MRLVATGLFGVLLACAVGTAAGAPAGSEEDPVALFERGNDLYGAGDYVAALECYRGAMLHGGDRGVLAFNTGNCWFRLDRFGPALHAYLVAELHRPRDARLAGNIDAARSRLGLTEREPWAFVDQVRRGAGLFMASEYCAVAAILAALIGIRLAWAVIRTRPPGRLFLIVGGVVLVVSLLLAWLVRDGPRGLVAVVLNDAVLVWDEPSDRGQALFSLGEGEMVRIAERRPGWLMIDDRAGHEGWVRRVGIGEVAADVQIDLSQLAAGK